MLGLATIGRDRGGELGHVQGRAAANADETTRAGAARRFRGAIHLACQRVALNIGEERGLAARLRQQGAGALGELGERRVGDDQHRRAPARKLADVACDLVEPAGAERDGRGRSEGETVNRHAWSAVRR